MDQPIPNAKELFTDRVEEIFCSALELENTPERRAHVERLCAGDAELQTRVHALLSAREEAGRLFDDATQALVVTDEIRGSLVNAPAVRQSFGLGIGSEDTLGDQIGPYRLRQILGEGGCGVVYSAEQEKPVHRLVALKVIKLGMDTKSVISRFDAERQALAMMDHPNIAHVFDAGATDKGRPYFVMELVCWA